MGNPSYLRKWKPKGQYVIYEEDNIVYSTDSPFWYWFFKNNELRYKVNKSGEV